MPGRDSVLIVLALAAIPACNPDGAEDPTILAPGASIPMGAVGAVGASFDPAPLMLEAAPAAPSPHRVKPRSGPRALPPDPRDPFADPPELSGPPDPSSDAGAVHHHAPGGTAL